MVTSPTLPSIRPIAAPDYFHVLAKPSGAICNLDCKYCFFLSKEALYPESRFRMEEDVLELYIKQLIESQRSSSLSIGWQGGEPTLMGLDFFRKLVSLVHKYLPSHIKLEEHTIQTNGTLLNDEWCKFFKEHNFLVGLSMDGSKDIHDTYRVDKRGLPTFGKVIKAARLLQKHGVEFNILCTVHAANGDRPLDVYRFFRDKVRTQYIQFIPIIERTTPELLDVANAGWGDRQTARPLYTQAGDLVTERSIKPEQWGKFLITIFDEWIRHDVGQVFIRTFDSALASWLNLPPSECIFSPTCGNALALEHNGDLYCCDHFVEPDYYLGNIKDTHMLELVASDKQRAFGNAKRDDLPQYCQTCEVKFACWGECPRHRFLYTPDGEPGLNYLCAGYKAFFNHINYPMKLMADLLRQGRPAKEVMKLLG